MEFTKYTIEENNKFACSSVIRITPEMFGDFVELWSTAENHFVSGKPAGDPVEVSKYESSEDKPVSPMTRLKFGLVVEIAELEDKISRETNDYMRTLYHGQYDGLILAVTMLDEIQGN